MSILAFFLIGAGVIALACGAWFGISHTTALPRREPPTA